MSGCGSRFVGFSWRFDGEILKDLYVLIEDLWEVEFRTRESRLACEQMMTERRVSDQSGLGPQVEDVLGPIDLPDRYSWSRSNYRRPLTYKQFTKQVSRLSCQYLWTSSVN